MSEPFAVFTSKVVPYPAENVDTDQIVPARYLKVTDKEGLAEALFRDWRFNEDGTLREPRFILDQPGMAGRKILPFVVHEPVLELDYPENIPAIEEALRRMSQGTWRETDGVRHPV